MSKSCAINAVLFDRNMFNCIMSYLFSVLDAYNHNPQRTHDYEHHTDVARCRANARPVCQLWASRILQEKFNYNHESTMYVSVLIKPLTRTFSMYDRTYWKFHTSKEIPYDVCNRLPYRKFARLFVHTLKSDNEDDEKTNTIDAIKCILQIGHVCERIEIIGHFSPSPSWEAPFRDEHHLVRKIDLRWTSLSTKNTYKAYTNVDDMVYMGAYYDHARVHVEAKVSPLKTGTFPYVLTLPNSVSFLRVHEGEANEELLLRAPEGEANEHVGHYAKLRLMSTGMVHPLLTPSEVRGWANPLGLGFLFDETRLL
jgi:hypothetical protein